MARLPLVLLPGLGASALYYEHQFRAFDHLVVPKWLPPEPAESLSSYARRLAGRIEVSRPFVLGGGSFGGILAYEMAQHLDPTKLILIAAARTREPLIPTYRVLDLAARPLPPAVGKWLAQVYGWGTFGRWQGLSNQQLKLLRRMVDEGDPAHFKWGFRAMAGWHPPARRPLCPVFQIHGDKDVIIPPEPGVDRLIPGGRHLIHITHAEQVNAFIRLCCGYG